MSTEVCFYQFGHPPLASWLRDWMQQQQYTLVEHHVVSALLTALPDQPSCLLLLLTGPKQVRQAAEHLLDAHATTVPVIVYGRQFSVTEAVSWMQRGAFSVLDESCPTAVQQHQLSKAAKATQQLFLQWQAASTAQHKLEVLSARELAVARLVAQGFTAAQVAQQLYISPRTAEAHKANIFKKLQIKSSTALAQLVLQSAPAPFAPLSAQPRFSTVTAADGLAATT